MTQLNDFISEKRGQTEGPRNEHLRFERLISDLSGWFVNISPDLVDEKIEHGLQQILEYFHVDSCGLLNVSKEKALWQITHAAFAEGISQLPVRTDLSAAIWTT